jgi:transposase
MLLDHLSDGLTAIRTQFGAIFVSLELSRSNWLITSLSPGKGEKISKHGVPAGDVAGL